MRFVYGKQNVRTLERAQENNFLLTNALGGYASVTAGYGVPRCDQGLLVAAVKAPNVRINMVHRMKETLKIGDQELFLSTQEFADGTPAEEGYRNLASFIYDGLPTWTYDVSGVRVTRQCVMEQEKNTTAMVYTLENNSGKPVTLTLEPFFKMVPRENILEEKKKSLLKYRTCFDTFSSPVSRLISSHMSASSSPRRKPVDRSRRNIS